MVLRPTAANLALSSSRVSKGLARPASAPVLFAILLSLLPYNTLQLGPPCWKFKKMTFFVLGSRTSYQYGKGNKKLDVFIGTWTRNEHIYHIDRVLRGLSQDVGAGDDAGTFGLDGGFNGVDNFKSLDSLISGWVELAVYTGSILEQNRAIAALQNHIR